MKTKLIVFSTLFFHTFFFNIHAQHVGLVMSGGGAKGIAHIGALKALEENDIPIDCIVGTSMGGIVGGFYAAGYSPQEIEKIALTKDFQNWVTGKLSESFKYFYSKPDENPSWLSIKMFIDTSFRAKFEPDLINDVPMNFALTEYLAQSSARSGYDFNNLVVPFRCLAADIFTQEQIIIRDGSLCTALRATLSVPFFFRAIKVKNKYLFDGGVYNNFPVDVIKKEFSPEVIIGCNVSSKRYKSYPYNIKRRLYN